MPRNTENWEKKNVKTGEANTCAKSIVHLIFIDLFVS